jgi:M6 family metalloprotease-like protein
MPTFSLKHTSALVTMVTISHRLRKECFGRCHVFAFLLLASFVSAIITPHPDSDFSEGSWITVHDYRRKLGIDYKYETKLLNPELCRFESEKDCRAMDKSLQEQAHRTLASIQSTGNLKVLVLLLQFDNHRIRSVPNPSIVESFFNSNERDSVNFPTGSIKTYLKINSHNSLTINADILPWFTVDQTEQECSFGNLGLRKDFQKCFRPILDSLDELHNDQNHSFDWKDYDENSDGMIDSLVVLHSGYGAEYGHIDPSGAGADNRIWSHSIGPQPEESESSSWISQQYSIKLGSYSVASTFHGNEGQALTKIGVILHEMLHTMSIPDLFDMSCQDQRSGIGSYSIMSNIWGQGNDGSLPGHLDPWSKIKLGWVTPKIISQNGTYTMLPSEYEADIYIIEEPYPEGEYLLIENRQAILYDANLWPGGSLIWHIDEKQEGNSLPGGPCLNGWPENGLHYRVALIQADNLYELEQNINSGHVEDFYTAEKELGPGGNGVYPNTDSYQGGKIRPTNIIIKSFQQDGFRVSFTVTLPEISAIIGSSFPSHRKCSVNANLRQCIGYASADFPVQDDCDCYNFCGNGVALGCCKFGEPCPIQCESGGLVAGCKKEHIFPPESSSDTSTNNNDDKKGLGLPDDPSIITGKHPGNTGNLRSSAPSGISTLCLSRMVAVSLLWIFIA